MDEAIDIFHRNQSGHQYHYHHYDLAVAQMEVKGTSESLKDRVEELIQDVPAIADDLETNVGDLVLKIQCLLEGKKPTYGNYAEILIFEALSENWTEDHR